MSKARNADLPADLGPKPLGSVEAGDAAVREPRDPLGKSPPDKRDNLTPDEAIAQIEDARRGEQVDRGVFNHARVSGRDKCGAKYGRCFGEIVDGKCSACGEDYTRRTPIGGVNSGEIRF